MAMGGRDVEKSGAGVLELVEFKRNRGRSEISSHNNSFGLLRMPRNMTTNEQVVTLLEGSRNEDRRPLKFETRESKMPTHHTFLGRVKLQILKAHS